MCSPDVVPEFAGCLKIPVKEHVQDPNLPRETDLGYLSQYRSTGRTRTSYLCVSPSRLLYSFCKEVEVDRSMDLTGGSVHTGSDLSVSS